ncbi:DUF1304 domain-containing protein [Neomicrococcus lactis]
MTVVALILVAIAALLHVYIFTMESVTWTQPKTRKTFGLTETQAEATKEMAFNQGFYNLFLAIVAGAGVVFYMVGRTDVGFALIFAGAGSMLAAALVLVLSSPDKAAAAIKQGTIPLLGLVALTISLLV